MSCYPRTDKSGKRFAFWQKVARKGEGRESAELWLAAQRGYVPVRLVVVEKDGTRYEQNPTRISP